MFCLGDPETRLKYLPEFGPNLNDEGFRRRVLRSAFYLPAPEIEEDNSKTPAVAKVTHQKTAKNPKKRAPRKAKTTTSYKVSHVISY
jgi:hypothetical protein